MSVSKAQSFSGVGRRDFIYGTAATAVAGGLLTATPSRADAATPSGSLGPMNVVGMANFDTSGSFRPHRFQRRPVRADDVQVRIDFSGVCHSDIHTAHGDWGPQHYPLVTGHEMAGVVTAVGAEVSRFKVGDRVGVGTYVDSCRTCEECRAGREQYCINSALFTYGNPIPSYADAADYPGGYPKGGYSTGIVVRENYVYPIPKEIDLKHAGPIMCAGVTVWSALRNWDIARGSRVGILGVGGLGHLAIQLAHALGAEVTGFTTSAEKKSDIRRFGAADVVVNSDPDQMAKYTRHFDFILDTIPATVPLDPYLSLLKRGGTLCRVGIDKTTIANEFGAFSLTSAQNSLAGSNVGSVRETHEVLQFAARYGIRPQVQVVPARQVGTVWPKVVDKAARYRFVLDMSDLR
ncbi:MULTISPECIES: alcohol dehydrogenase catalytic domain-containing protein [Streptomyces]|uniref:alcohol dehydrogenase catalytic domain-containing protein n=1 Tax=Streptomyces TaxID=1883 RepID=UPI001404648F